MHLVSKHMGSFFEIYYYSTYLGPPHGVPCLGNTWVVMRRVFSVNSRESASLFGSRHFSPHVEQASATQCPASRTRQTFCIIQASKGLMFYPGYVRYATSISLCFSIFGPEMESGASLSKQPLIGSSAPHGEQPNLALSRVYSCASCHFREPKK